MWTTPRRFVQVRPGRAHSGVCRPLSSFPAGLPGRDGVTPECPAIYFRLSTSVVSQHDTYVFSVKKKKSPSAPRGPDRGVPLIPRDGVLLGQSVLLGEPVCEVRVM